MCLLCCWKPGPPFFLPPDWLGGSGTLFDYHKSRALGFWQRCCFLALYLYSCQSLTCLGLGFHVAAPARIVDYSHWIAACFDLGSFTGLYWSTAHPDLSLVFWIFHGCRHPWLQKCLLDHACRQPALTLNSLRDVLHYIFPPSLCSAARNYSIVF